MPETNTSTVQQADKNLFIDGEKVAVITAKGFQMLAGKKEHRPAVEAYLASKAAPTDAAEDYEAPAPLAQPEPLQLPAKKSSIPPCPPMDPMAGDKTPEVVAWYKKYKPEEFTKRYANRRYTIEAEA